ncbi:probable bZIP transcription factor 11 at C-terminar half [Coccomyxa sp. Obi]|nr:probable bZIP transcription factor 11 at C-terminar half [Coccomyxa sp. Obi]
MTDFSSLLDISRFPSVALIDVEPAQEKAENLGNGLSLTETHLLPFAFHEPRGSRVEGGLDSNAPQTITTGTRDNLSEGDKNATNKSPRSTLEDPMLSNSTIVSAQYQAERHGMRGSNDWGRDNLEDDMEDDEEDYEDDDSASAALRHGSVSGEESNLLRRSARNHGTDNRRSNEKRKVGRPIIYCGDPDSPDLTPQERRRIRRRIANRESARRVRAKRQDLLEDMSIKVRELEEHNAKLMQRAASVETKHAGMMEQVAQINACLQAKSEENERLQAELERLRQSLLVGSSSTSLDMDMLKEACGNFNFTLTAVPAAQPQPVLPQTISSGFAGSAFGPAAGLPLEPLCGGVPRPSVISGATMPLMNEMAPSPHPARVLSKELSLGQVAALSLDRSLSEFLKEVTCF